MDHAKMIEAKPGSKEIAATRVFGAPRELVWRAWTRPEHVAQWWGPNGFTSTITEMDVRPGGVWRLVMHGPDGTDYKNKIVFVEVVEPERLVFINYNHSGEVETDDVHFQAIVLFTDQGDKTEVSMRMEFESTAERDRIGEAGAFQGLKECMDRLTEYVGKMR